MTYHNNALSLTQLKKESEFEWLNDTNSQSLQSALRNLDTAYSNFFNKKAKFPNFKKKSNKQSFNVPQNFSIHDNLLDIPKCKGIKIKLHRAIEGTIKSITISRTPSGKYLASILCELEIPEPVFPLPPPPNPLARGFGQGVMKSALTMALKPSSLHQMVISLNHQSFLKSLKRDYNNLVNHSLRNNHLFFRHSAEREMLRTDIKHRNYLQTT